MAKVADIVFEVGERLGRKADDVQPYADLLADNWFDTVDSLLGTEASELVQLGIPLRFGKEFLDAVKANEGHSRDSSSHRKGRNSEVASGDKSKENYKGSKRGRDGNSRDDWHRNSRDEGRKNNRDDWYKSGRDEGNRSSRDENKEHYSREETGGRKGKGKGKSKRGKGGGKERDPCRECGEDHGPQDCPVLYSKLKFGKKVRLRQDIASSDFPLAKALIGEGGKNVKHIKEQTGAWVFLNGAGTGRIEPDTGEEDQDYMHLLVKAEDGDTLYEAFDICLDLVKSVYAQYREWCADNGLPIPEGDGKGKGKSRGKDRGKDKDKGKGKSRGKKEDRNDSYTRGGDRDFEDQAFSQRADKEYRHYKRVDINHDDFDPDFPLARRIIGKSGRNLKHINDVSGAKIVLRGVGSGDKFAERDGYEGAEDALHIVIKSDDRAQLEEAERVVMDLLDGMRDQQDEWRNSDKHEGHDEESTAKTNGRRGNGKVPKNKSSKGFERQIFLPERLEDADPKFDVMGRVVGEGNRNLMHIEKQTGVWVQLSGAGSGYTIPETGDESTEPLHLLISCDSEEKLQEAGNICNDLIETIAKDYDAWQKKDSYKQTEKRSRNGSRSRDEEERRRPPVKRHKR